MWLAMDKDQLYNKVEAMVDYYHDRAAEVGYNPIKMIDLHWFMFNWMQSLLKEFRDGRVDTNE